MDAPLWMPLVYGGYKINMKYIKSQTHATFQPEALIAQLVEHLTSDQEAMSLNPTSGNDTISKKYNTLFNN